MTTLATSPTSVARQIADTRRLLSASLTDEIAVLAAPYSAGDTGLSLSRIPSRLGPGTVLCSGAATWMVTAVSGATCQVISGYEGNPDVSVPAGSVVRVAPRFTDYQLFTTIRQVIGSLSSAANGLYGTVRWTGVSANGMYPIPDEIAPYLIRILSVRKDIGTGELVNVVAWDASVSQPALYVRVYDFDSLPYEFVAATKIIVPPSFETDLIADCGMSDTMLDLPSLGAASILMHGQEARRVHNEAQGDPRRAENVPMTGGTNAGRELRRIFRERIVEEAQRLQSLNGLRLRFGP